MHGISLSKQIFTPTNNSNNMSLNYHEKNKHNSSHGK